MTINTQSDQIVINHKRERFVRIAEARVSRAIKSVRLIRNLANTCTYEYTVDELKMILASLQSEIDDVKRVFEKRMLHQQPTDHSLFSLSS